MAVKTLKRSFWQRLLGKPVTSPPLDASCWSFSEGKVVVDLSRAPELSKPGSAVRLEGVDLPKRILVVHGDDGEYYAFCNQCGHGGRRLDPVPETNTIQCCSIGKSTYSYEGKVLAGPAKKPVTLFPVQKMENLLEITIL
ncbi:MAG TPA: Rieske 2Fe-2S domain-containing protein [Candidatus Hydrogenedentes bacterium]|nr:Rieske 2Fe-2S domain-containing protein [Candidatus Hydrogenedentota bacterium]